MEPYHKINENRNKTKNAWQSQMCSPPGANAPAKLRGYWTNVRQIFIISREVIGGVMRASMLRSFHPLWNNNAENEGKVCQFSATGAKNRLP